MHLYQPVIDWIKSDIPVGNLLIHEPRGRGLYLNLKPKNLLSAMTEEQLRKYLTEKVETFDIIEIFTGGSSPDVTSVMISLNRVMNRITATSRRGPGNIAIPCDHGVVFTWRGLILNEDRAFVYDQKDGRFYYSPYEIGGASYFKILLGNPDDIIKNIPKLLNNLGINEDQLKVIGNNES